MSERQKVVHGLTIMSPLIQDEHAEFSHVQQLRMFLSEQPRDGHSPFANIPGTHTVRLAILDALPSVGRWAESLNSPYLIFEANVDGDSDFYLRMMASTSPAFIDALWSHCVGYPGAANISNFIHFMKKCQVDTTLFFADVSDRSFVETFRALHVQRSVLTFIGKNQGKSGSDLKQAFLKFLNELRGSNEKVNSKMPVGTNEHN